MGRDAGSGCGRLIMTKKRYFRKALWLYKPGRHGSVSFFVNQDSTMTLHFFFKSQYTK